MMQAETVLTEHQKKPGGGRHMRLQWKPFKHIAVLMLLSALAGMIGVATPAAAQNRNAVLHYSVSMPQPNSHLFHVELSCTGWDNDTARFKMPKWMPGYYQLMDYSKYVKNFSVRDSRPVSRINDNTYEIVVQKGKPFSLGYDVVAERKFVANP